MNPMTRTFEHLSLAKRAAAGAAGAIGPSLFTFLGLVVAVSAAACAAPAEEDSSAGGSAATDAPKAETPPLKAGFYDGPASVLRVYAGGGGTLVALELNKDGYTPTRLVGATVSAVGDHFEAKTSSGSKLTLTPTDSGLDVKGVMSATAVDAHFAPRADKAFDGTWASQIGKSSALQISGSSATSMEFDFKFDLEGAQTFEGRTTATSDAITAISVTNAQLGDCTVEFSSHRSTGSYFYASARRAGGTGPFPEACKAIGFSVLGYSLRK